MIRNAILLFIFCFIWSRAQATDNAIQAALSASGVKGSDSLQVKINLILDLLNDKNFLGESDPDPKYAERSTFNSTSRQLAQQLMEKYRGETNSGDPFNPYNLGTLRTPSEMLSQRIGGACETYARSFASILQASGVPADNIRIIDAVTNDDYRLLCPSGEGGSLNKSYPGGNGHAMVMVKTETGQWKLINTSLSPIGSSDVVNGTHQQTLLGIRNGQLKLAPDQMMRLIRSLDESDVEMKGIPSPQEIEKSIADHKLVQLPELQSLPSTVPGPPQKKIIHFRDLSVFLMTSPDRFPKHSFEERPNLIASGSVDGSKCRFNPKSLNTSPPTNTQSTISAQ